MPQTIVAVVPVFHPDAAFSERLRGLAALIGRVVVVDDGSQPRFDPPADLAVETIRQANLGIAAAINAGLAHARRTWPETEFFVTVDQDSSLAADYLSNALSTYASAAAAGVRVGGVCSERFNDWNVSVSSVHNGFRTALQVAQSGLVIPRESIDEFGLFDETLFIDSVDTEFVLRMLARGVVVVLGDGCRMDHQVGAAMPLRLFGRQVRWRGRTRSFAFHSALRRYYISRNRVVVYRRYARLSPRWLLRDTALEARTFVFSILFGPDKSAQVKALWFGCLDGFRGRLGKVSPSRARSLGGSG